MKALLLIALIAPAAMADVRVEPRQFVKEEHFFFSGGLTWLNRNDYYVSPGGILSAQYYFSESNGPSSRTRCSSIRARRRCGPKRSRRWRRSPACCRRCRRVRSPSKATPTSCPSTRATFIPTGSSLRSGPSTCSTRWRPRA